MMDKYREEREGLMNEAAQLIHEAGTWKLEFHPGHKSWIGTECYAETPEEEVREAYPNATLRKGEEFWEYLHEEQQYYAIWRGRDRSLKLFGSKEFAEFVFSAILDRQEKINWADDAKALAVQLHNKILATEEYCSKLRAWLDKALTDLEGKRSVVRPELKEDANGGT